MRSDLRGNAWMAFRFKVNEFGEALSQTSLDLPPLAQWLHRERCVTWNQLQVAWVWKASNLWDDLGWLNSAQQRCFVSSGTKGPISIYNFVEIQMPIKQRKGMSLKQKLLSLAKSGRVSRFLMKSAPHAWAGKCCKTSFSVSQVSFQQIHPYKQFVCLFLGTLENLTTGLVKPL